MSKKNPAINKKKFRKEYLQNNSKISIILNSGPLTPENNTKLHSLLNRNKELLVLLNTSSLQNISPKNPNLPSEEPGGYCKNCGAPNGNNNMNGKPWCFRCNRPLIITFKKPERKPNPKLKGVTVEEQEEFFQRQKELGIGSKTF